MYILYKLQVYSIVIQNFYFYFWSFFFLVFLGLHQRRREVPRLGVESELQLPAYTIVTATRDLSHLCDLPTAHSNAGFPTH